MQERILLDMHRVEEAVETFLNRVVEAVETFLNQVVAAAEGIFRKVEVLQMEEYHHMVEMVVEVAQEKHYSVAML